MRGRFLAALLGGALLVLSACGAPGGGTPAPLAPPTDLTVTAGDQDVDLSWQASAADTVVRYNVYRGTTSGDLTKVGDVNGNTLSYRASGLVNGTEYFFAVDAEDSGGKHSARSDEVSATPSVVTALTPPTVRATSPTDGAPSVGTNANITVTFSKPMDSISTEAAFSASPGVSCTFTWSPDDTRLTCNPDADLDPNQAYTITIDTGAQDQDGNALATLKEFTFTTSTGPAAACILGTSTFGQCTFGS